MNRLNITVNDTSFLQDLNVSNIVSTNVPDCQHFDPSNPLKCLEYGDADEFQTTDLFAQWSTEGDIGDNYNEVEDKAEEEEDSLAQYCVKTWSARRRFKFDGLDWTKEQLYRYWLIIIGHCVFVRTIGVAILVMRNNDGFYALKQMLCARCLKKGEKVTMDEQFIAEVIESMDDLELEMAERES